MANPSAGRLCFDRMDPSDPAVTRVGTRLEIVGVMRQLMRERQCITVMNEKGELAFATRVLAVEQDGVWLEGPRQAAWANEALLFLAALPGMRVQFGPLEVALANWEGERALRAPLPDGLLKLQRRDDFRLILADRPLSGRLVDASGAAARLEVLDISAGGLSLGGGEGLLLAAGDVIADCRLDLPDSPDLPVSLEVRHIETCAMRDGTPGYRAGCRFVNLTPAASRAVTRFVIGLQRGPVAV